MRIMAIDPGLKKIGIAVSDPTGTVARALEILPHTSMKEDVRRILALAEREGVEKLLLGATHLAGTPATAIMRYTHRLMAGLRDSAAVPVLLADESFSTRAAQHVRIERGERRKTRRQADDALAAAALLQEYLDDARIES